MKQGFMRLAPSAKRVAIAVAVLAPLVFAFVQPAAATSCTSVNGTETLPGTSLGTIGAGGCTIGTFTNPATSNSSPASVSPVTPYNPSIYSFTWGGGVLSILVETGNNGYGYDIDFELGVAASNSLNADKSLSSHLASTFVPWDNVAPTGGPSGPVYLLQNVNLAAGTYVLDTYLGSCSSNFNEGNCSQGIFGSDPNDPNYMVDFAPGTATTPLPGALPLFGTGLGVIGVLLGRQKRKTASA